jgi:hypothetical protein
MNGANLRGHSGVYLRGGFDNGCGKRRHNGEDEQAADQQADGAVRRRVWGLSWLVQLAPGTAAFLRRGNADGYRAACAASFSFEKLQ